MWRPDLEETGNEALSCGWGQYEIYNTCNNEIKPWRYYLGETGNKTVEHRTDFSFISFVNPVAHLIHTLPCLGE